MPLAIAIPRQESVDLNGVFNLSVNAKFERYFSRRHGLFLKFHFRPFFIFALFLFLVYNVDAMCFMASYYQNITETAMNNAINLNEISFTKNTLATSGWVAMNFETGVKSCEHMGEILKDVGENRTDVLVIRYLMSEGNKKLIKTFDLKTIPTMIMFKDGVERERSVKLKTRDEVIHFIDRNMELETASEKDAFAGK